ncbi:MAG: PAS domain-containing protein [Sulfurimonas sp.]|jgi:PAS domain S-box-containing protein|nr:PAS domain-containing protein [Sulfurimonadaceae bacterium]
MPIPVNQEIKLDPKKYIVSKTDKKGVIEYGNEYFIEVTGYRENELIGKPHNIIRHPDMPRIVFKMMWDRINAKRNIAAVVKNMAKDGRYYWVVTEFEPKLDPISDEIISHIAYRKAAPRKAIEAIEPIYKKLLELEKEGGMEASERFLREYLEQNDTTYDKFIDKISGKNGLFAIFFNQMKKLFR